MYYILFARSWHCFLWSNFLRTSWFKGFTKMNEFRGANWYAGTGLELPQQFQCTFAIACQYFLWTIIDSIYQRCWVISWNCAIASSCIKLIINWITWTKRIQRIRKEGLKDMIMTTTSSHSWLMLIKLWWMEGRLKARSVSLGPLFQVLSDFFLSRGSLLIGTLLLFSWKLCFCTLLVETGKSSVLGGDVGTWLTQIFVSSCLLLGSGSPLIILLVVSADCRLL